MLSTKSFMYMKTNKGPRRKPLGNPGMIEPAQALSIQNNSLLITG